MKIPVLGLPFDALTLPQAVGRAEELFSCGRGGMIATVNSEILLRYRQNARFAACVDRADLILADGVGVVIASGIIGTPLPERVAGADLTPRLLERLSERGGSVFLYGARPGVAERAGAAMERRFPGLCVTGAEDGYTPDPDAVRREAERSDTDLLLVGLGAPRQEEFMARSRDRLGAVMIGVGGWLDVMAGDVLRAPESMQRAGLEWLYRLYRQPARIIRTARLPQVLLLSAAERLKNGTPKGPAS